MDGEQEKMDVAEAVALMDEAEPGADVEADAEAAAAAAPEVETEESVDEAAPEFWSADDKQAWKTVPAELRPVLKKYEQQRVEFVNEKAREAAAVRAEAARQVDRANATADQSAAGWQQAGPALQRAFADKWSEVKWAELAETDPKQWARLNQQRLDEAAVLSQAQRRGEAEMQAAQQRAAERLQQARNTEHARLADRLPDWFGTSEAAEKTYRELGNFLFAKGIPAERINAIYEAPIIELALNAFRFEQAQQAALRSSTRAREGHVAARPTPTRVAPGPATSASQGRAGNRQGDAARQAGERFRKSGGDSIADAAELIRLSGL